MTSGARDAILKWGAERLCSIVAGASSSTCGCVVTSWLSCLSECERVSDPEPRKRRSMLLDDRRQRACGACERRAPAITSKNVLIVMTKINETISLSVWASPALTCWLLPCWLFSADDWLSACDRSKHPLSESFSAGLSRALLCGDSVLVWNRTHNRCRGWCGTDEGEKQKIYKLKTTMKTDKRPSEKDSIVKCIKIWSIRRWITMFWSDFNFCCAKFYLVAFDSRPSSILRVIISLELGAKCWNVL